MRHLAVSVIGLSTCLVACTAPLSPGEVFALADAKARWAARPFQSYTYEYSVSCGFCAYFFYRPTRVSVNNGQVVGVVVVANDSAFSPQDWKYFATIDDLFARIPQYAREDWVRDVKVEYDPQWGYPTLISTPAKPGIADVGGAEYIRNLVPAP